MFVQPAKRRNAKEVWSTRKHLLLLVCVPDSRVSISTQEAQLPLVIVVGQNAS